MNKFIIFGFLLCIAELSFGNIVRNVRDVEGVPDVSDIISQAVPIVQKVCARVPKTNNFDSLQEGFQTFIGCIGKIYDLDEIKTRSTEPSEENFKAVLKESCEKDPEVVKCVEAFSPVVDECLKGDEIQFKNSVLKIAKELSKYVCENDSQNILNLIAPASVECLMGSAEELKACLPIEKYSKNIPDSGEELDGIFNVSQEECDDINTMKSCISTTLGKCESNVPAKFVNDVFNIFKSEITCGNIV